MTAAEAAVRVAVTVTALLSLAALTGYAAPGTDAGLSVLAARTTRSLAEGGGLLHPLIAVLTAGVCVVAAFLTPPVTSGERSIAATVAGVGVIVGVPLIGRYALGQQGVHMLGVMAAGAAAGLAIETPTVRAYLVRIWAAGATFALAAAAGSSAPVVVTLILGGVGVLASLVLCQRLAVDVSAVPAPAHPLTRRSGRARTSWVLGPIGVGLIIALIGTWALSRLPTPPAPGGGFGDLGGSASAGGSSQERRTTGSDGRVDPYLGGDLDLSARGDLGSRPMFEVPGAPASRLWRATALDVYEGGRWTTTPAESGAGRLPDGGGEGPASDLDPSAGARAQGVVGVLGGAARRNPLPVLAPGRIAAVEAEDLIFADGRGGMWLLTDGTPHLGYRVTWQERPSVDDVVSGRVPAGGRSTGVPAEPSSDGEWLRLPSSVSAQVAQLSRQVLGPVLGGGGHTAVRTVAGGTRADARDARTPALAAAAVEDYLRANYTYSLDAPQPKRGRDAVDAFLFDDKVGFCEQFATAAVMLLRAAGIPARLATGFVAPAAQPAEDGLLDRVTVTSAMAHAWVEVYVDGVGWVSSDPTAGTPLAPKPESSSESLRQWLRDHGLVLLIALGVLLVVGVAAVAVTVAVRRRRRRVGPAPSAAVVLDEGGRALLAAFGRLERALAARGVPRRPSETVGDLSRRLAPSAGVVSVLRDATPGSPTEGLPEVADALHVLERVVYGGAPPPRSDVEQATARLDEAARVLSARR